MVGHPADYEEGAREYPIQNTLISVIYRVQPGRVQILRVLDQRNQQANLRNR